jgi:hypothetical protein
MLLRILESCERRISIVNLVLEASRENGANQ